MMKIQTSLITFWFLLLGALNASAAEISSAHLASYTAAFNYYSVDNEGHLTLAGTWDDDLKVSESGLVRTVTRKPLNKSADLIRAVAATVEFKPLYLNQRFGPDLSGVFYTDLSDHVLHQVFIPNVVSPAIQSSTPLTDNVLEANLQGVLASALPFEEGSELDVIGYQGGRTPESKLHTFQIHTQETVEVMGKAMSAWKISDTTTQWTYWVRKEPPYLVKVSHPTEDGKGVLVSELDAFSQN
jgi:hypothetical protein